MCEERGRSSLAPFRLVCTRDGAPRKQTWESGEWTYIRAKQSWHSFSYVTPSVPQTRLNVWEQSGDSAICSQMGYEREDRREGTQGFRGTEEQPRVSAWSQRGPRKEPDSRRPQCGSSDLETNHSGSLGIFACVYLHDRVCGYVYISVYLCLLSPSMQIYKCVPVFMSVSVELVCALKLLGQVHTLLRAFN